MSCRQSVSLIQLFEIDLKIIERIISTRETWRSTVRRADKCKNSATFITTYLERCQDDDDITLNSINYKKKYKIKILLTIWHVIIIYIFIQYSILTIMVNRYKINATYLPSVSFLLHILSRCISLLFANLQHNFRYYSIVLILNAS